MIREGTGKKDSEFPRSYKLFSRAPYGHKNGSQFAYHQSTAHTSQIQAQGEDHCSFSFIVDDDLESRFPVIRFREVWHPCLRPTESCRYGFEYRTSRKDGIP